MKIPAKGLDREGLSKVLKDYKKGDLTWRDGKTFSYVYNAGSAPEEVCKEAYMAYLSENGLNPTVFPSLLRLENEVVAMASAHLGGNSEVVGNFTSGGTESIILAVKTARDWAREKKPQIEKAEIILPITAHAAFHKAAHYLDVKKVLVPVDPTTCKVDLESLQKAITPSTILLVGSAPSYAHGVVDPIEEMAKIAREKDLLLHVDGCIGAFLLPFLRRLGRPVPAFDFSVEGVTSISMDFHKYAYAAKGASVVLYRNKELRKHQFFTCSEWTGYSVVNATIQSSKSGGPLAAAWAVLNFIGEEGYLEIAKSLQEATEKVIAGVGEIPELRLLGNPEMTLVAATSDEVKVFHILDEMKERGWYLEPQLAFPPHKESFHLTITPANVPKIDQLIQDLKEAVQAAKELPSANLADQMSGFLSNVNLGELKDEDMMGLLAMVGIQGSKLPSRMAPINEVLNVLPAPLRDGFLKNFCNELFRYQG